jgi:hypothetical protein
MRLEIASASAVSPSAGRPVIARPFTGARVLRYPDAHVTRPPVASSMRQFHMIEAIAAHVSQ